MGCHLNMIFVIFCSFGLQLQDSYASVSLKFENKIPNEKLRLSAGDDERFRPTIDDGNAINASFVFDKEAGHPVPFGNQGTERPDILIPVAINPGCLTCSPDFVLDREAGHPVLDWSNQGNTSVIAEYCQVTQDTQEECIGKDNYTWISCLNTCVFTGLDAFP